MYIQLLTPELSEQARFLPLNYQQHGNTGQSWKREGRFGISLLQNIYKYMNTQGRSQDIIGPGQYRKFGKFWTVPDIVHSSTQYIITWHGRRGQRSKEYG
jgi:hypothetical protein